LRNKDTSGVSRNSANFNTLRQLKPKKWNIRLYQSGHSSGTGIFPEVKDVDHFWNELVALNL